MAVAIWLLAAVACSATRLQSLQAKSAVQPSSQAAAYAHEVTKAKFSCSSLTTCGDCFFAGCFFQPSAPEGKRCAEACMITAASCYGTFAPYEIAPPHNVIACPAGTGGKKELMAAAQHSAAKEAEHNAAMEAHKKHLIAAAMQAGLSPKAAAAHAAAAIHLAAPHSATTHGPAAAAHAAAAAHVALPSVHDKHGCSAAKGTSWCASLNKCIAHFEERCPHGEACSGHLTCADCTAANCFFAPGAHGQPKCQPLCLISNGNCYGTFSPAMIPPPHNHVACPAAHAVSGPDAKCRAASTCEECFAHKCFWTPEAHANYKCNSKCPIVGAPCFGTFDPHFIAFPHNVVMCPSMAKAHKKEVAKKLYTCKLADVHKWDKKERGWCCTFKKVGCLNTVNCQDETRMMNWSGPVRRYCCATHHKGCAPIAEEILVNPWPETGLTRSKDGWHMDVAGGFMISDPQDKEAFVKFVPVLAAAAYKVDIAFPSSPLYSRNTVVQVEATEGRTISVVDMTAPFYANHSNLAVQWHSVGVFNMNLHSTVVVSATSQAKGALVVAGMRFTPLTVSEMPHPALPTLATAKKTAATKTAAAKAAAVTKAAGKAGAAVTKGKTVPAVKKAVSVVVCPHDVPLSFEVYATPTKPDFSVASPDKVGCVAAFSVASVAKEKMTAKTGYSVRYFATVFAPSTGSYLFNVTATGSAHLLLDGHAVVNGRMTMGDTAAEAHELVLHPRYGKVHLTKGMHKLEIQYVNLYHPEAPYLDVFFTGPDMGVEPLFNMVCTPEKCAHPRADKEAKPAELHHKLKLAELQHEIAKKKLLAAQAAELLAKAADTVKHGHTGHRGTADLVTSLTDAKEADRTVYPAH